MSVTTKYRILRLLPTKLKILCILTFFLGQLGRAQNLKTKEFINSDHKYEFTPYTLSKALTLSGFKVESMETAFYDTVSNHGFFHKMLYKRYPLFRDDLIIVANF